MKIELISQQQYDMLKDLQESHPILTFQNEGYEYIDKSKFDEQDEMAFYAIQNLLRRHIVGFYEFNNFYRGKKTGKLMVRFQYDYGADDNTRSFKGVGYLELDELLNGFNEISTL
jgi:hypothetical protein